MIVAFPRAVMLGTVMFLLCAALPCFGSDRTAARRHYEGTAYDSGDGHVLYLEEHYRFVDASGVTNQLVLYRCPSGEPFARKKIREIPNDEAPDFELLDARRGYQEGVRSSMGHREAFVRTGRESPLRTVVLPERANPVVDAGFDAFVSNRWSELDTTGKGRMAFVVPSRLGYLDMRIKSAAFETMDGEPVRHVRLVVDAWFGILAPTIELFYASADHAVRRFEGPSNILDTAGRRQDVRIEFPASGVAPAPTHEEVERAEGLPLTNRCPTSPAG